jgi:RNase P/RNase MRP subunit POP5
MATSQKLERARYIAIGYGYNSSLSQKEIWKVISSHCHNLFGIKGLVEMGLYLQYASSKPFVIFRVSSTSINNFLMCLASCREFNKKPIVFFSLKISGTIKGLQILENLEIIKTLEDLIKKT